MPADIIEEQASNSSTQKSERRSKRKRKPSSRNAAALKAQRTSENDAAAREQLRACRDKCPYCRGECATTPVLQKNAAREIEALFHNPKAQTPSAIEKVLYGKRSLIFGVQTKEITHADTSRLFLQLWATGIFTCKVVKPKEPGLTPRINVQLAKKQSSSGATIWCIGQEDMWKGIVYKK